MTNHTELIFYIISLLLIASGIVISMIALFNRSGQAPRYFAGIFNPRYWVPIWKTRPYFTARGFRLYVTGSLMATLGAFIALVNMLV